MGWTPPRRSSELEGLLQRDHTLLGGVLVGIDGHVIEIQARAVAVLDEPEPWNEAARISGMARGAMREALDRIRGAFSKLAIPDPEVQILVNLAPADLPKEGTSLDLPLAIVLLQAAGMLPDLPASAEGELILAGELGLHGEVRRIPGALSLAFAARPDQALVVPSGNEKECALITATKERSGCRVLAVESLEHAVAFFRGERALEDALSKPLSFDAIIPKAVDFGRIKGQERAKQAALISAAGGHNLLLIGPPGEGKSLLASAIPGILPGLSMEERVHLTRIYSACGQLEGDGQVVTRRPMRPVHHSASKQAIVGGGSPLPRAGEVTLAHLGVLFLDELPEFPRPSIEALRQPIEDGLVTIARVGGTISFPSRFTLVAAMNPCPCGYFGTDRCRCSKSEVLKYQGRLSGPIVDRIDLQVEMQRLTLEERFGEAELGQTDAMRARVEDARARQRERYRGSGVAHNAGMPGGHVREYANFSDAGWGHFKSVIEASTLTTRSMDRLAKVSRTVADLEGRERVEPGDVDVAGGFVIGGMLREALG